MTNLDLCMAAVKEFIQCNMGCGTGRVCAFIKSTSCCDGCGTEVFDFVCTSLHTEPRIVNQHNTINTGGGHLSGVVAQGNATQTSINNTVTITRIEGSQFMDSDIKQNLSAACKAVETSNLPASLQKSLSENLARLVEELDKPKPEKTSLEKIWEGVKAFASEIKPIVDLGASLAKAFGNVFLIAAA